MRSAAPRTPRQPSKWAAKVIKIIHGFVTGVKDIWSILVTMFKPFIELFRWSLDRSMLLIKWLLSPEMQLVAISVFFVGFFAAVVWQYGDIGEHYIGKIRTPAVMNKFGEVVKNSAPIVPVWGARLIGMMTGLIINTFQMLPHMGSLFNKYARAFAAIERDAIGEKFETFASKAKAPLGWSLAVMGTVSIAFFTFELVSSSSYAWEVGILGWGVGRLLIGLAYVIPFMVFGPGIVLWATSHGLALITHYANED